MTFQQPITGHLCFQHTSDSNIGSGLALTVGLAVAGSTGVEDPTIRIASPMDSE